MQDKLLRAYAVRWMSPGATLGEAEAEITDIIRRAARKLAPKFVFGSFTVEDAEQQATLFGLEALAKGSYDVKRPLAAFVARHLKNRLHNWKRDNFMRPARPCKCCEAFGSPENPCDAWKKWNKNNRAKMGLARASLSPEEHNPAGRKPAASAAFLAEVEGFALKLPFLLRNDFLRLKAGVSLSDERSSAVLDVLRSRFGGDDAP